MRILIGNDIDVSIRQRKDMRSWAQRILWFAKDGDLVVLPDQPDKKFLQYVTSLTRVDPSSLRIHVPPPGDFGNYLMDRRRLSDERFVKEVAADLDEVSEIFALWPSAQISRFAEALQLTKQFSGAEFFSQGGGEVANSKANFRALAAAAGVPTAAGEVCRSIEESIDAMGRLLARSDAVVVKQAHNWAGSGNQVVIRGDSVATDHAGAKHIHYLAAGPQGIRDYWRERWEWASVGGRFPVVIEEFRQRAISIYSEYHIGDNEVRPTETGTLFYVGRWLSHQAVPLRGLSDEIHARLVNLGLQLARTYQALGYRGYFGPDALLDESGELIFTEANARVSGSAHLWGIIGHKVVDVWREPMRSVVEYHWPKKWRITGFDEFVAAVEPRQVEPR